MFAWLQDLLERNGLQLPDPGPVTFVKSTCEETLGAAAYTSEGAVFLASLAFLPEYYTDDTFPNPEILEAIIDCLRK